MWGLFVYLKRFKFQPNLFILPTLGLQEKVWLYNEVQIHTHLRKTRHFVLPKFWALSEYGT